MAQAAAAMAVGVGSFCDPDDVQVGLNSGMHACLPVSLAPTMHRPHSSSQV
jgi:hypothetical protein